VKRDLQWHLHSASLRLSGAAVVRAGTGALTWVLSDVQPTVIFTFAPGQAQPIIGSFRPIIDLETAMPTYLYQCKDCGQAFEKVLTVREHERAHKPAVACPKCESRRVVQLPAAFQAVTAHKA
jgi:putative FmdB family regulatory protein